MLSNDRYDNIKAVYKLSKIAWFIQECAVPAAKREGNDELVALYEDIIKGLDEYTSKLYSMLCRGCSSD